MVCGKNGAKIMTYFFLKLLHPWLVLLLFVCLIIAMIIRNKVYAPVVYKYSLATDIKKNSYIPEHPHKKIIYFLRFLMCAILAITIGKLQLVDVRSKVPIQGIDIVLVLDVSGSMQFQDYEDDSRSRFDVAKAEAIRFIKKRYNDALGLVLFGKDTVSRCPITSDRQLLEEVVRELSLGVINADGTMLITGMVTAANRLKHSKSKSKVMILLTDGEPSEGDMDVSVGIDIAKKLGIKVYTIGIGSEQEQMFMHPLYGFVSKPKVNKDLLTEIARATGGRYFMASSAADMRCVYDTIDTLEKTDHEVPVFSIYHDLVFPCIMAIIVVLLCELFLSTFVWFAL
jgi:Ca-activated chloride channel family protein